MPETFHDLYARVELNMREWDILTALGTLPEHPHQYSPARIAKKLELPPAEVDRILQDLSRRNIIKLSPRRKWTAWRVNPFSGEWLPPQPKHPMVKFIERFLKPRRRPAAKPA